MKRVITLSNNIARTNISGADNVDVDNIDSVINCSVDTIFAYILEFIPQNNFTDVLKKVASKLRQGGDLYIKFTDYKNICNMYTKNEITDNDLLNFFRGKSNIISIDTITSLLDHKYSVSKIDFVDGFITMSVQRTQL